METRKLIRSSLKQSIPYPEKIVDKSKSDRDWILDKDGMAVPDKFMKLDSLKAIQGPSGAANTWLTKMLTILTKPLY